MSALEEEDNGITLWHNRLSQRLGKGAKDRQPQGPSDRWEEVVLLKANGRRCFWKEESGNRTVCGWEANTHSSGSHSGRLPPRGHAAM